MRHVSLELKVIEKELESDLQDITASTTSPSGLNRIKSFAINILENPALYSNNYSNSPSNAKVEKYVGNEIKLFRTFFIILFTLIALWFTKNTSGYRIIAWLMIVYYTKYFITFIFLYSTTTRLSVVNVQTSKLNGFGFISFPTGIEYHRSEIIYSISQLSAIRGSNVHIALYNMTTNTGVLLFASIAFKWHEINTDNWSWSDYKHLSLIFGLTTAFGIFLLGIWELNKYSKLHVIMHYIGIVGLMTSSLAISFQGEFSVISIVICTVNGILWINYLLVSTFCFRPNDEKQEVDVHFASMICITFETIGWIFLAFSIVYFVYNFHVE